MPPRTPSCAAGATCAGFESRTDSRHGCIGCWSTHAVTWPGEADAAHSRQFGDPIDMPAMTDDYRQLADHDELERAFAALPADQRIALVLTHYIGYTAPELARILDVPTGTVYSRLHYGTRAMREALAGSAAATPTASEPVR